MLMLLRHLYEAASVTFDVDESTFLTDALALRP